LIILDVSGKQGLLGGIVLPAAPASWKGIHTKFFTSIKRNEKSSTGAHEHLQSNILT